VVLAASGHAGSRCDRDSFGDWKQIDHMNTRHRVLALVGRDVEVSGADGEARKVVKGTWTSPFTGTTYRNVDPHGVLEVDHLIPVCWAWEHGAAAWSKEKRKAFYNDERFLVPVEIGLNRAKGAKGVMDFVPDTEFACRYVELVAVGIGEYQIEMTQEDSDLLRQTRGRCSIPAAVHSQTDG
jgi:hypothetical protein